MIIKDYNSFVNEGVGKFLKDMFSKIIKFFVNKFGAKGHFLSAVYMTKKGIFKKMGWGDVEAYDFSGGPNVGNMNVDLNAYPYDDEGKLDEAVVPMKHPHPDVVNMDAKMLKSYLIKKYMIKKPVLIWGAPGVGKTAIIKQVAEHLGIKCLVMNLSVRDPVDFAGMPDVREGATYYNLPAIFPRVREVTGAHPELHDFSSEEDTGGILFFDEINRAQVPVLNTCLQLVLDRRLDLYTLPINWVCFAAANRPDTGEAPTVTPLEAPLLNRFRGINYFATVEDWVEWAIKDAKVKPEFEVPDILPAGQKYVGDDIIGFLMWRPDYLHMYDPDEENQVWPSPRSWDEAAFDLEFERRLAKKEGRFLSNTEIEDQVMAPNVGNVAAKLFTRYLDLIGKVDIKELHKAYDDPQHCPLPPVDNPDLAHAMMLSVALVKKDQKITLAQLYNVLEFAKRFKSKEMVSPLLHYVVGYHPEVKEDKDYHRDFLRRWYEFFPKAAGFQERAAILAAEDVKKKEAEEKEKKKKQV